MHQESAHIWKILLQTLRLRAMDRYFQELLTTRELGKLSLVDDGAVYTGIIKVLCVCHKNHVK